MADPLDETVQAMILSLVSFMGFGFLTFVVLVRSQLGGDWAWLRTLGERFSFFLSPRPPENMVVMTYLDGRSEVFYNVKIERVRRGWEVRLPHATYFAPKIKESWTDLLGSNYPVRQSTPYNIAIRAIGGLMTGAYIVYILAISNAFDYVQTEAGRSVLVASALLAIFYTVLAYRQAMVPNLRVVELVEWGISPAGRYALPSIGPRGMSPIEYAKLQGYELKVEVPSEVRELFEKLRERYQRDDIALAKMLAKAEEAEKLKVEIGEVKRREVYSREIARHMVLTQVFRFSIPRLAVIVLVLLVGVLIGYALGGGSIVFVPPEAASAGAGAPPQTPAAPPAAATPAPSTPGAASPSLPPATAPGGGGG